MTITITIIIPAYNESQRISRTLFEIDAYITKTSSQNQIKVITVDDGSIDNTENVVKNWIKDRCINKQCFETISYLPNHGKVYAVREGFLKAESDVVLYTDADGACSINELEKLMLWLDRGFDITCGSRILKNDISEVKMSFKRRLSGLVFHSILKFFGLASPKTFKIEWKTNPDNLRLKLILTSDISFFKILEPQVISKPLSSQSINFSSSLMEHAPSASVYKTTSDSAFKKPSLTAYTLP